MLRKFQSEADFREALDDELAKRNLPESLRTAVVAGIAEAEAAMRNEAPRVDPSGMKLRIGTWFIRDDDMPVFDAFATIGGLAATALTGGAVAPATAITSGTAISRAIWQVWRKGGRLSMDEMKVLNLLAARGASTTEGILAAAGTDLEGHDAHSLESLLREMTEVELRDGSVVALIRQDPDGRWRKLNV